MKKNLIIGLGNILVQDEGIGVHFVNFVKDDFPDFEIIEIGNLDYSILEVFEDRECVIVVDAVPENFTEEYVFVEFKDENFSQKFSFHEIDLSDLIGTLKILKKEPERIFIFGIRPHSLNPSFGLSDELRRKMPYFKEVFREMLLEFGLLNEKEVRMKL